MSEERLQEIKDSVNFQREILLAHNMGTLCVDEEQELIEEIERLNNIIGTIKGMFNDCDNHFEDGCDCNRIEEFLRIVGSDKD